MAKFGERFLSEEDQDHLRAELEKWEKDPNYAFDWSDRMSKRAALVLEKVIDNASGSNAANHILSAVDKITRLTQVLNELNRERLERESENVAKAEARDAELDRLSRMAEEKGKRPPELIIAKKRKAQESDSGPELG